MTQGQEAQGLLLGAWEGEKKAVGREGGGMGREGGRMEREGKKEGSSSELTIPLRSLHNVSLEEENKV